MKQKYPNDDAMIGDRDEVARFLESKAAGMLIDDFVSQKCAELGVDPATLVQNGGSPLEGLMLVMMKPQGGKH